MNYRCYDYVVRTQVLKFIVRYGVFMSYVGLAIWDVNHEFMHVSAQWVGYHRYLPCF